MAKKPQPTKVEKALQKAHLFKWEIDELTATKRTMKNGAVIDVKPVDLQSPPVKAFIRERSKAWRDAEYMARVRRPVWQSADKTVKEAANKFREQVYQKYIDNNWISDREKDKDSLDFWKFMRAQEEEYKDKHPDYADSPRKKQPGSHHKTKMDSSGNRITGNKGQDALQKEKARNRRMMTELGVGINFVIQKKDGVLIKHARFNADKNKFEEIG